MESEQNSIPELQNTEKQLKKIGLNVTHFPALSHTPISSNIDCITTKSASKTCAECHIEKELLNHAVETLQEIYIVIDAVTKRVVRWNNTFLQMTKLIPDNPIYLTSFLFGYQLNAFEEATSLLHKGDVQSVIVDIRSSELEKVPIKFHISKHKLPDGKSYYTAIGRDISSDVESNKKLIESQNKYETIFNSAEDGIIIFDPISGIVDGNNAAVALFKLNSKEQLTNSSFLSLSASLQLCETSATLLFKQYLEDIILFGTKVFKWKFERQGEQFSANVAISKFDFEGKTLFNARIVDISHEQRRLELLFMERNLSISLQSESTTKSIMTEALDHLLTLSDIDAGIALTLKANSAIEVISQMGLTDDLLYQLSGFSFSTIAKEYFQHGESKFFSREELIEHFSHSIDRFETSVWIPTLYSDNVIGIIILLSKGNKVYSTEMHSAIEIVNGIIHNAVVRSRVEEELRSSEERHRSLVENAPYGIFLINVENEIQDVNSAASELTGIPKGNLLGTSLLDYLSPSIHSQFIQQMHSLQKNESSFGEYLALSDDSTERYWSISSVKISDESCLSFAMDVSKTRQLEIRINQKEKMEAIGQLAGGIAHDFNNQLTGIIGYSELLRDALNDDSELIEFVDFILTATKRSSEITSQLLAYARKGKYIPKEVDIHKILLEVLDLLKHTIDKRILLENKFNKTPLLTIGDATQLQNMFLNLAINARDAMPKGGTLQFITSSVDVSEDLKQETEFDIRTGSYLKVVVKDTGTGMNESTRKRVFEPFFTTKEKGKGTGMGLAAVYGTVKNHKGYIKIKSELQKGTEFHIYLPLSNDEAINSNALDITDKEAVKVYGTGNILIVDDDEMICNTLSRSLTKLGYETATCYNGIDAVDYYKKNWMNINLVILDMVMPLMSGKDTFFELLKINEKCKVVVSSGFTSDKDVEELLEAGALQFIQKPYSITKISSTIFDIINA